MNQDQDHLAGAPEWGGGGAQNIYAYIVQMLVAAGYVSQAKVDEAYAIASQIPLRSAGTSPSGTAECQKE